MTERKFKVENNWCNCHPETCCCNPYKVVNTQTGKTVATVYLYEDAMELADALEKAGE